MKDERKQGQFSRFSRRLTIEGLLKALLIVLTVGFGVAFVVSTIYWFVAKNALWLCLGIVAGVLLVGVPVVYMIFFRPTIQSNARRIDRLGLEERMITMVEYENDDSILSRLQREDAQKHLAEADEKQMKICVPRSMIISVSVAAFLGCLMTTLSTLAALGYILSGAALLDPIIPDPPVEYVYIEYIVEQGGYIEGAEFQEIIVGENGTEVIAIPEDGWVFAGWEDGGKYPSRSEVKVSQDQVLIAIFEQSGEGNGSGEGEGEGEGEEGEGEGEPQDKPSDAEGKSDSDEPPTDQTNPNAAGGKYDPANQIMNGETFYRDVYDQYADEMQEEMSSGEDVPEDVQDIVETYFEIIG